VSLWPWGGITFDSYDDTLKWGTTYFHKDDWNYLMDMPTIYSLIKTDGQGYKTFMEEHSNSVKAGYALPKQAHLSLSFQCNILEVLGPGKSDKTDHPFGDVATYDKWQSTGTKQVFRDSVEDDIRQVEVYTSTKVYVQL
jgi:hypothetical protein